MNLNLGEFIVMPNHVHGIIMLGSNEFNNKDSDIEFEKDKYQNQLGPQSKNLSSIIRGYKAAVTTFSRKNNFEFEWQPLFNDHIIRSKEEYYRISDYIHLM